MSKKLMFISASEPLAEGRVRLPDGRELVLDSSGQLDAPLDTGELEVLVAGKWKTHRIDLMTDSTLTVIDVSRTTGGLIGSVLGGRYRIDAALGAGGMGVVYKATDTRLGRDVAIKMLSEQFRSNEEARRLFLEEARQMSPLSHPHLVSIFDVTTIDGFDVMVTELISGENLDEILQARGPMDIDEVLRVGYQLTMAVGFLHDEGLIHRDLKPANAMLTTEGSVKLIDFGLARSLEHLIARGTAVRGTPAYMAPEQILNTPLSSATDIYQLGVTLYELLANDLPIDSSSGNLFANVQGEPRPLASLREGLPDQLVEVIHACIDKEPERRPTATALAEVLGELHLARTGEAPYAGSTTGVFTGRNIALGNASTLAAVPPNLITDVGEEKDSPTKKSSRGVLILAGLLAASILAATFAISLIFSDPLDEVDQETLSARAVVPTSDPPPLIEEVPPPEDNEGELLGHNLGEAVSSRAQFLAAIPVEEVPVKAPQQERPRPAPSRAVAEKPVSAPEEMAEEEVEVKEPAEQASAEPKVKEEIASEAPEVSEVVNSLRLMLPERAEKPTPTSAPEKKAPQEQEPKKEEPQRVEPQVKQPPRGF